MNLLYTTCYLDVSGVTKLNLEILKALKEDFDVHIVTTDDDAWLTTKLDGLFEQAIRKPIRLHSLKKSARLPFFLQYIKDNRIDLIFNTHSLWVYEHLKRLKTNITSVKIVDSLHVLEPYCFRGGFPDMSANRYVHPFIDCSIVISEHLRNYMLKNYKVDAAKLTVIRNAINTDFFRKDYAVRNLFKAEINLKAEEKLIGFIGRMTRQKRPDLFVEIARQLIQEGENVFFYMIGSGPLSEAIMAQIKRNNLCDRFFIFDRRDDISFVLNSSDLLLVPSAYEGAPLTILEALASEVPVIASDVGALREYVLDTCSLVRIDNSEKINFVLGAKRLLDVKNDMTDTARFIRKNYNLEKMCAEYKKMFLASVGLIG